MRIASAFAVVALLLASAHSVRAGYTTIGGPVTGYFFVDRWGQGVIAEGVFVDPELKNEFPSDWRPVKVEIEHLERLSVIGGGPMMITKIHKIEELPEPAIKLSLKLEKEAVEAGQATRLHISIENVSDKPIELDDRDHALYLAVTQHTIGEPNPELVRKLTEEAFAGQTVVPPNRDAAGWRGFDVTAGMPHLARTTRKIRLTCRAGQRLFAGEARGEERRLRDDATTVDLGDNSVTVAPGKSVTFEYAITEDWAINEYELQLLCGECFSIERRHAPGFQSPPVLFGVLPAK